MTIEHSKISDNVNLQLAVYKDDIVNGFTQGDKESLKDLEKIMSVSNPVQELFKETIDAKNMEMKESDDDEDMNWNLHDEGTIRIIRTSERDTLTFPTIFK